MKHALSRLAAGLAVVVLCAVFANAAQAQTGKVTGTVTDAQSGAPLEGAQVILQGTGITALTGANGRFFVVNVPPATYTVVVRRIGYTSAEVHNVIVQIDVTRTVDVELSPAGAVGVEEIRVTAEEVPLVQPGATSTKTNIRADEIAALPVTNIMDVLSLQQGFIEVPQNTDLISFSAQQRNPITPIRIRGGRAGESLTLLDGVPINNFVFGGPAFDITNEAVEQVDFNQGGFEPQYGNALSGIINIATREGGTNLAGAIRYQTSAIGGALGNTPDELQKFNLLEGFLSGPIPGTGQRLRFMAAGRVQTSADRVLKFDNDVYSASGRDPNLIGIQSLDLFPGWRAFGYNNLRDITGKLTYYFTPTAKLSVSGVRYEGQRLPFDFDWILEGFYPLSAPAVTNLEDSLSVGGSGLFPQPTDPGGSNANYNVVQGSIYVQRTLFSAKWDHTLGRWAYKAHVGYFDQQRETCNVWQGVCLGKNFQDINFNEQFVAGGISVGPTGGTSEVYGGEHLKTTSGGVDVQGQVTDHHQLQFGGSYTYHNLVYSEFDNVGINDVFVVPQYYAAKPWEGAIYLQDRIEYDFLTVRLGARFDWGSAPGKALANPRDPTNGTTAREICNADSTTYAYYDSATATQYRGFGACALSGSLLAQATAEAAKDDFVDAGTRTQFSPRIGVSFPLTERSMVYFNFGRYSQNPLYNNIYQNTGNGTVAGDSAGFCSSDQVISGTDLCYPVMTFAYGTPQFVGNPNLLIEKTTQYEFGFATELGGNYALQISAYSKDQFGLTGTRAGGQSADGTKYFDVGATYGSSTYNYWVLVNQDFQTVRGLEVNLRRRLLAYWGFNLNFGLTQATTNAAAPDLSAQNQDNGDPQNLKEIRSEIDVPASFNASVFFRVGNEQPFGIGVLDQIVKNASATITLQARSGFPYTPQTNTNGLGSSNRLEENSGRAPGTMTVNLQADKNFWLSNLQWGVFMRVSNLLDKVNCQQVYATTGLCDAGRVDQSRRNNGNSISGATSTYLDRASYFGARRSINFGARVSF